MRKLGTRACREEATSGAKRRTWPAVANAVRRSSARGHGVSRCRPVPLLLGAEFSAGMARAALATAPGWQAYARAHDPLVLGLLGLAEFLPALLLALPAGHLADRHDRRIVAAAASTAATLVALVLALDAASGDSQVWPLYVLAACAGAAAAFEAPAFNPLLAASVPAAALARVISLSSVSWQS